jgi:hypothetical protein
MVAVARLSFLSCFVWLGSVPHYATDVLTGRHLHGRYAPPPERTSDAMVALIDIMLSLDPTVSAHFPCPVVGR